MTKKEQELSNAAFAVRARLNRLATKMVSSCQSTGKMIKRSITVDGIRATGSAWKLSDSQTRLTIESWIGSKEGTEIFLIATSIKNGGTFVIGAKS